MQWVSWKKCYCPNTFIWLRNILIDNKVFFLNSSIWNMKKWKSKLGKVIYNLAQLQRKQGELFFKKSYCGGDYKIPACQDEISSCFSGTVFTLLLHAKITALKDNETENGMWGLKKLLTFEFCFTMEMYWKYHFFSLDKWAKTITWDKNFPGKAWS